jgi:alpha-glucoside transport system permease protein
VTTTHKFLTMFEAIGLFVAVVGVLLAIASRFSGRRGDRVVAATFLLPTVILISVGRSTRG